MWSSMRKCAHNRSFKTILSYKFSIQKKNIKKKEPFKLLWRTKFNLIRESSVRIYIFFKNTKKIFSAEISVYPEKSSR